MKKITLKVQKREVMGKKMRAEADTRIPAVVYGEVVSSQALWVDSVLFARAFSAAGTNTVVSLEVEGEKSPVNVLIFEFQTHPVSSKVTHIDFFAVNMKEEVETEIPLVFVGIAPAVKTLGGTLVKTMDQIEVRALPANLPHEITVDLSVLVTFDDHITVADLPLGENVHILVDKETMVALVAEPRSEEELAALDATVDADVSKIEGVADKVVEEKPESKESKK